MSLLQAVENATKRVTEERQKYFDATILSAGARAMMPPRISVGSSAGAVFDQLDPSYQSLLLGGNHSASSGVPPPLPPPPPCENCLMLKTAVQQLRLNINAVEDSLNAQIEQLQDTVAFVEGERHDTRRQLQECFAELQHYQTLSLQKDARIQEERGRCQRLELLLESEARRSAHVSHLAAGGNVTWHRDLIQLSALEVSERSALLATSLLQAEVLHVTHLWEADVIRADAAARLAAKHSSPERRSMSMMADMAVETGTSPVARSLADAINGTSPVPQPTVTGGRTHSDSATIRILQAEVDALTTARDTLIDQLTASRHETIQLQRAFAAAQQQQQRTVPPALQTFDGATSTSNFADPAPNAAQVLQWERELTEVDRSEVHGRTRVVNFQVRDYLGIIQELLKNVIATLNKERRFADLAASRASEAWDEERRLLLQRADGMEAEISTLRQQVMDRDAEIAVLRTLPPPPSAPVTVQTADAGLATSLLPGASVPVDHVGLQVNLDEDKDRELSTLRNMLFKVRDEATESRSALEESRSKVTELERLLLEASSKAAPNAPRAAMTTSVLDSANVSAVELLPPPPALPDDPLVPPELPSANESAMFPVMPPPTKKLPSVPMEKLPATWEQLEGVSNTLKTAFHNDTTEAASVVRSDVQQMQAQLEKIIATCEMERKADAEKLHDALAAVRYALRNLVTNASHHQRLVSSEINEVHNLAQAVKTEFEAVKTLTTSVKTEHDLIVSQLTVSSTQRDHHLLSLSSPSAAPSVPVASSPAMLSGTVAPMPAFSRPPDELVTKPPAALQPTSKELVAAAAQLPPPPPPPPQQPTAAPAAKAPASAKAPPVKARNSFDDSDDEAPPPPPPPSQQQPTAAPQAAPASKGATPAAAAPTVSPVKEGPPKRVENSMISDAQAAALRPKPKVAGKR